MSYDLKEKLESDVKIIINDFDMFMKEMRIKPPYKPGVKIQTAPFLIKWDEPNKGIILPYWDELTDEQKELFEGQIKIAQKLNLPLLVHTRKAFSETIAILKKNHQQKKIIIFQKQMSPVN